METSQQTDPIHQIWDNLADFDAASTDDALTHLLRTLCQLLNAQRAYWLGAVRVASDDGDVLDGWRPAGIRHLDSQPSDLRMYQQNVSDVEAGVPSESSVNHARQAGNFRAVLLRDHVSSQFFASAKYQMVYGNQGLHDALFVIFPVNQDAESYCCFMRAADRPLFTTKERELAATVLRAVKWFHRQVMLSYGLLVASDPLSVTERRLLGQLLSAEPEKRIAEKLGLTHATTHTYITRLYRKFGVTSRAGLTALWLRRQ